MVKNCLFGLYPVLATFWTFYQLICSSWAEKMSEKWLKLAIKPNRHTWNFRIQKEVLDFSLCLNVHVSNDKNPFTTPSPRGYDTNLHKFEQDNLAIRDRKSIVSWYPAYQPMSNLAANFGWAEGTTSNQLRINSQLLVGPMAQ